MAKKHWIYIKRGLSEDPKHRSQMGECIWLFMHIIDRADWETGIAYDWKDKEEAVDMSMPVDTLRYQRQKLEEMDYIRCKKKQYSQDISIMEWKNPRDYGSEIKNQRCQSSNELPLSNSQSDNQSLNQSSNQLPGQVKTPTYSSKSKVSDQTSLNFKEMTIPEARKVPTLQMYFKATGFFPGDQAWEYVHNAITRNGLTEEQIRVASVEWVVRGYRRENVKGILEWAAGGIPATNGQKQAGASAPAVNTQAVESTIKMLEEKWSVRPAPPPASKPRLGGSAQ